VEEIMPRYFSLEQAHDALENIRPVMEEIQSIRKEILARQPEVWPVIERAAGNGGNRAASLLAFDFERLDELVHQIMDTGAVVKDLDSGLLDFPALREGHEVYLCWQQGEERIDFWHEKDAGFAGRQPIEQF
jgi:hypothetical protein